MRIALFGPTFPFRGGIAHYTTLLYRKLKEKHNVRLFGFSRFYPLWLHPARTDRDVSDFVLREPDAQLVLDSVNPRSWVKLARMIAEFEPDLVIFSWWISFWAPHYATVIRNIRKRISTRILFICHNVVDHEAFFLGRRLTENVLKRGDLFLVHSEEDLKNLKAFLPDAHVRKVLHPNYEVFHQYGVTRKEARQRLHITKETILFFGFVRPYKGLSYLLQALAMVCKRRDVELIVAGEFWKDKDDYLRKIRDLKIEERVRIIDEYIPNEEIEVYFKAADLLVMPYVTATGSGVVQLAFAFDLPVIVTNVGALPEVVKDGETGYVVPNKDVNALAGRILNYFENQHRAEFASNIEKDKQRFSWDKLVETIETLYETR